MKLAKFIPLLVIAGIIALASKAKAQDQPLYPYVFLAEQFYTPLPNTIGPWQESDTLIVCQRSRTVEDGGCWFDDSPYGATEYCAYPDHAIADSQVGVYVPGVGCTEWKSTSYTWVSGDGSQTGTFQDE